MTHTGTRHPEPAPGALAALTDVEPRVALDRLRRALEAAARRKAESARERSENVGVAYVVFAVERPARFRRMVGCGAEAREGCPTENAAAAYRIARDVLVSALTNEGDRPELVADAEVLGWWSVVHGLAFLAIDGHLRDLRSSPGHLEDVVRSVLRSLERLGRDSPRSSSHVGCP
jgi:hypothetical protein